MELYMGKKREKRSKKTGLPAGSLVHIGKESTSATEISVYRYNSEHIEERHKCTIDEVGQICSGDGVRWVEVDGVHDVQAIQKIGDLFRIHPLVLEDIVNTDQRPKREEFEGFSYFVLKMIRVRESHTLEVEQVSFVVKDSTLITFQEGREDVFEPIRHRLRTGYQKLRAGGVDHLLYTLIDSIVDHYFIVLEDVGESLNELEEELISNPSQKTLPKIYSTKRCILTMRRAAWPLREMLSSVMRGEASVIQKDSLIYFRDIYDHAVEIIDIIENAREMSASMIDVYLSSVSNRLNDIMRVLTVITVIFMPLTFIVGVYGMNFEHMPELRWEYGYPAVLLLMLVIAASMSSYFKRRGWL